MIRMRSILFLFIAVGLLPSFDNSETENRYIEKEPVTSEIEKNVR